MQHPNPATVNITHIGGTPEQRARAEVLARATAAMFPDTGKPHVIRFSHTSDARGYFSEPDSKSGINKIKSDVYPDTIVHETLHAMQFAFKGSQMNNIAEDWAVRRTGLEKKTRLKELTGDNYGQNEYAYKDGVDSPYTLKEYLNEPGIGRFNEVIPMAFTVNYKMPITKRKDKKLLRVGVLAILNADKGGLYVDSADPIWNYV